MVKFYAKKKAGMVRAKSGKYYYPKKKIKKRRRRQNNNRRVQVYRDPFPMQTRRRLTYAFRTTVTPPTTSVGGFSINKQTFLINSCFDPDKTVLSTVPITGTSSRMNHQPMGFDQLMGIYSKYMVTYARLNVNFAFEHPTTYVTETFTPSTTGGESVTGNHQDNTPCRVGIVTSDGDDLPASLLTTGGNLPTFEKLIEQAKSGQLQPRSAQFKYRTLRKDGFVNLKCNVNPYKFYKIKNGKTWSDFKEDNLLLANQEPGTASKSDPVYAHLFVSPLTTVSGNQHSPVSVYGTIDFDVNFADLISLGQS
jgi:hypothetical protein